MNLLIIVFADKIIFADNFLIIVRLISWAGVDLYSVETEKYKNRNRTQYPKIWTVEGKQSTPVDLIKVSIRNSLKGEGRMVQQPKCYDYNNYAEDTFLNENIFFFNDFLPRGQ